MAHVRFPIHDDNGMPILGYLEIDIDYFQRLANLNHAANLIKIIEPARPWPGTIKDCAHEGCISQVIFMGDRGWLHYGETTPETSLHKATPKED